MTRVDIDRMVAEAVEKALAEISVDRRPIALDLKAAMDYSGMSKTAINQLLREEKITARKFGVKNLILRESLDRYLSSLPAWGSQ